MECLKCCACGECGECTTQKGPPFLKTIHNAHAQLRAPGRVHLEEHRRVVAQIAVVAAVVRVVGIRCSRVAVAKSAPVTHHQRLDPQLLQLVHVRLVQQHKRGVHQRR